MKILIYIFSLLLLISLASAMQVELVIPEGYEQIIAGEELITSINIINMGSQERLDVVLEMEIKDDNLNILQQKSETVAIETQANFVRTYKIPEEWKKGHYNIFVTVIEAENTKTTASSAFLIVSKSKIPNSIKALISILFIIAIAGILVKLNSKTIDKIKLHKKIFGIVKTKLGKQK